MLREQHIGADNSACKRKWMIVHLLRCDTCDYEWRADGLVVLLCPVCGSFAVEKKEDLGLDLP
jgi:Zn finger protein HypA/HybF involved in hydrogenase expression